MTELPPQPPPEVDHQSFPERHQLIYKALGLGAVALGGAVLAGMKAAEFVASLRHIGSSS